jgi:cytochrome c oxidase subunit IV
MGGINGVLWRSLDSCIVLEIDSGRSKHQLTYSLGISVAIISLSLFMFEDISLLEGIYPWSLIVILMVEQPKLVVHDRPPVLVHEFTHRLISHW